MEFYKPINPGTDYTIIPFKSYANQRYTIISGSGGNPEEVTINRAEQYPADWSATGELGSEHDISGFRSYTLFASIEHLYYSTHSIDRLPYASLDIESVTEFLPSASCFVINLAQYAYGERIYPGTFQLDVDGSLYDVRDIQSGVDGLGLLYISASDNIVGNIFYNEGVAVIQEDVVSGTSGVDPTLGVRLLSGSTATVVFQSQITIYQHRIVCKISGDELNTSLMNPTSRQTNAMAAGMTGLGDSIRDLFRSGSLTPYQTSVGLYNAQNDLVAIAKLASPIKRTKVTDQIFIIQFDSVV